jgi:hypothetical protein
MTTNDTIDRTGLRAKLEKMQGQIAHFEGLLELDVFSIEERKFLRKTINSLFDSQNEIYRKLLANASHLELERKMR